MDGLIRMIVEELTVIVQSMGISGCKIIGRRCVLKSNSIGDGFLCVKAMVQSLNYAIALLFL